MANKATFTYGTDDVNGTDGTPVWIDAVATAYDRTNVSGAGVGPAPPTVPATIAAPVKVNMVASQVPTLSASKQTLPCFH